MLTANSLAAHVCRLSNKLIKSDASSGGLRPPCGGAAYLQGVEQTNPQKDRRPQCVDTQPILHPGLGVAGEWEKKQFGTEKDEGPEALLAELTGRRFLDRRTRAVGLPAGNAREQR